MAEGQEQQQEVEVDLTQKKIKARGTDIIAIVVLVTGVIGVVLMHLHMQQSQAAQMEQVLVQKETAGQVAAALKELASTNRELITATKVTNCLIARDSSGNRFSLADCERITR